MPLPLPDLDKRRFDDLVGEMRALIPQLAPGWTNHNISDPGITLLELLAWVTEVNLYRANRIPARTTANFITLLLGESSIQSDAFLEAMRDVTTADIEREAKQVSTEIDQVHVRYAERANRVSVLIVVRAGATQVADIVIATQKRLRELWLSGPQIIVETLESAKQSALRFFNDPYRAITPADFEREAMLASPKVGRVSVTTNPLLGTITVVPVADPGLDPDDVKKMLAAVTSRLEERKLVGTSVVVRSPLYTDINLKVHLVVLPNTVAGAVTTAVSAAVKSFFDPFSGGRDLGGWSFGRLVSVYELYHLIESVPGVDHVDGLEVNGSPAAREVPIEDLPKLNLESLSITAVSRS